MQTYGPSGDVGYVPVQEKCFFCNYNVAWPTALFNKQKSFATNKLFESENSDATATLLSNVVQLLPNTAHIVRKFKWGQICDKRVR